MNIPASPTRLHSDVWRKMMEEEMEKGKSVAEAAEATMEDFARQRNLDGGTAGLAYLMTLGYLECHWQPHGEALRQWHARTRGV